MISRPLDLASKLRPEPRSFHAFFFVNGGLIVLFFSLFASQYVHTPAVGIDFRLPEVAGATASARPATHYIAITGSGRSFMTSSGALTMEQLRDWLKAQARNVKAPATPLLRVHADVSVSLGTLTEVSVAAREAGFDVGFAAIESRTSANRPAR